MKKNPFKTSSFTNYRAKYSNRVTQLDITKHGIHTEIQAWECPDGTGYWVVFTLNRDQFFKVKYDNQGKMVQRQYITPEGMDCHGSKQI